MCCHAGFRRGKLGGGKSVAAREHAGHQAVRVALCILLFVSYILLICIVFVTVPFVSCSVKLLLSRPMSFCLFLSILLPTPGGRGGRATAWPFCCQPRPNCNSIKSICCSGGAEQFHSCGKVIDKTIPLHLLLANIERFLTSSVQIDLS